MGDDELHESSYFYGLEIGLRTALCCKSREDIKASLATVTKGKSRRIKDGEKEWQAWMVELEMLRWDRDRLIVLGGASHA